jgi:hypothetical protein
VTLKLTILVGPLMLIPSILYCGTSLAKKENLSIQEILQLMATAFLGHMIWYKQGYIVSGTVIMMKLFGHVPV